MDWQGCRCGLLALFDNMFCVEINKFGHRLNVMLKKLNQTTGWTAVSLCQFALIKAMFKEGIMRSCNPARSR